MYSDVCRGELSFCAVFIYSLFELGHSDDNFIELETYLQDKCDSKAKRVTNLQM